MTSGVSYRCPNLGRHALSLSQFRLHVHEPTPTSNLYKAPPSKRSWGRPKPIGQLKRLPLELLHETLLNFDYPSLNNLRLVNRTACGIVESLPAYSLLRTHALDTLRVMDAANCSFYIAIGDLFEEFCHPWCRTCPGREFAPLLYLPTMTRSCFKCNTVRDRYQPGLVTDICSTYALSRRDMNNKAHPLPIIRTIPNYPPWLPRLIADIGQAEELAVRVHGSLEAAECVSRKKEERDRKAYEVAELEYMEWYADDHKKANRKRKKTKTRNRTQALSPTPNRTPPPRRPRAPRKRPESLRKGQGVDNWRFHATVALPCFDRKTQTVERGGGIAGRVRITGKRDSQMTGEVGH